MSSKKDYDLLVIGAGSGGVRASRISASYGAKVAVIEENKPGGTCVLRGCVPKKLLVYASEYSSHLKEAEGFGWDQLDGKHNWLKLIINKNKELDRLSKIYSNIITNANCDLIFGKASFVNQNQIKVNDEVYSAGKILIATGSKPFFPSIDGLHSNAIDSDEAMELEELPKKIVIYGSGYIAVEFAGIFNSLGSEVHLVYRAEKLLKGFDEDIREKFEHEVTTQGIKLYPNCLVTKVEGIKLKSDVYLSNNSIIKDVVLLSANGRLPNIENLNLNKIGIKLSDEGAVKVDAFFKTNIDSIFAIGDVTHKINLTPVALREGHAFADTQFGLKKKTFDYSNVPTAVFSQPPISVVGITEEEAANKNIETEIYVSSYKPLKHTLTGSSKKSFMKLVVEKSTSIVLGAHMMGEDSPEIIQGIAIAIKARLTKNDFDETVAIHPTAAEEFVTMRKPRDK